VQYFPLCEYRGDGKFVSMLTGEEQEVSFNKKMVDATYLKTTVPSTHTPNFSVADDVRFMPLNDLPKISQPPTDFVVIGGGKTGIDACLWLLENGVNADKIKWIVSRDAWLIDRKNTQPGEQFFSNTIGGQALQFEAVAASTSIENMFDRLEESGVLVRIDQNVRPQMFHGATVSQAELTELRKIKNVVRLGRVKSIETDKITLDRGEIPTTTNTVHVDCSASAISNLETKPIFNGDVITPQTVRSYQPVFSASFIAHIEATRDTEEEKNRLCGVVPLPNHDTDWIRMLAAMMMNQYNWGQDKELRKWLNNNRLDGFGSLVAGVSKEDKEKMAIMGRIKNSVFPAIMKLQEYVGELDKQNV
ncbi:MAG: NAD(P)/FAD-dependent oxidoreductase, partial [Saprospiraceae bacterium]